MAQLKADREAQAAARPPADAGAVSAALRLARGFAERAGLAAADADTLAIVMEEWVANVVEHGGPAPGSRIVLRLDVAPGAVRLRASDAGRPFDPRAAPLSGPNPSRGGGVGLQLIAGLARVCGYSRRGGRNHLALELPLTSPKADP